MKKVILLALLLTTGALWLFAQNEGSVYAFQNGNWYNGKGFEPATWYSVQGKLTKKTPETPVDSVIDLTGRWIVPPLGDAFCSSLAGNPSASQQIKLYAGEGVFYLQVLGNTQEGRKAAESLLATAGSPDVQFANGAFTCTLGHPFLVYEAPAQGVRNPLEISAKYDTIRSGRAMLGDGYWFADSKSDVDKIWKNASAQKPDVISIYLLDAANSGGKETKGLKPDVAKALVKKAHRAGLRVFAHIETADDLRLGLKLGVDGFANLPGHNWNGSGDTARYALTDQDLKKLAKKKTAVIPLFSHAQFEAPRPNAATDQAELLKRLLANGVNVIAGSDDPQRTIRSEINYWFQFGNLNYEQIINVLCVHTPQAIFPKRKIGAFQEGYEANFLVLKADPLTNLLKLRAIDFVVKGGELIR